jgi:hypothetical protein
MSFDMERSAADKDLTVTNTLSGEEQVSDNPLDNVMATSENRQNVAYSSVYDAGADLGEVKQVT